jgi:hypothetical protein
MCVCVSAIRGLGQRGANWTLGQSRAPLFLTTTIETLRDAMNTHFVPFGLFKAGNSFLCMEIKWGAERVEYSSIQPRSVLNEFL